MSSTPPLNSKYPWTNSKATPLIIGAPMRLISTAPLTTAITQAGGLGFLGAGTDPSTLDSMLAESSTILSSPTCHFQNENYRYSPPPHESQDSTTQAILPIGVGFIIWGIADSKLESVIAPLLTKYLPVAIWLYAPRGNGRDEETSAQLKLWARTIREATDGKTEIWAQVGSVAETECYLDSIPQLDVLVVQGVDAGGHGLKHGAGLISLLPEVVDVVSDRKRQSGTKKVPRIVAAGGIVNGRQAAAAAMLGAEGVVLGTRLLASPEANIPNGYKDEVVRAGDGGVSTVRSSVYDVVRGTPGWPERYGGRGVVNETYRDWVGGEVGKDENEKLYKEAEKNAYVEGKEGVWGPKGRMTTYAGTGVGSVKGMMSVREIVEDVRNEYAKTMQRLRGARC